MSSFNKKTLFKEFSSNRLLRVTAYCRRLVYNCRQQLANRQVTALTTQDLDRLLTCCVNIVQQILYGQEIKDLLECQEVLTTSSLRTLHLFITDEGIRRVGGRLQQSTLPYYIIYQLFCHLSIIFLN